MVKAVIVGYGNIGKSAAEAALAAPDFELIGIIRRGGEPVGELPGVPVAINLEGLAKKPDVAILCVPSRKVLENAELYLGKGISTADSFDIHSEIWELHEKLDAVAKKSGAAAVMSAGWDPGSDSVVRALWEAAAPRGITYTNFGPGMSMGHTVAVKAIRGVRRAISMTIPLGTSIHRRMVYVELEPGAESGEVENAIKTDAYFAGDETHVAVVPSVEALSDMGHGVLMERKGVSGLTQNQRFKYEMSINNPALTGQLLVAAARAALRQRPGCYTLPELPMLDLLPGEKEELIRRLV